MKTRLDGWHAQFEWKLADLWVGAFWKRTGSCVDLWVCVIPCVPLHVSWWWQDAKQNTIVSEPGKKTHE